MMAKSPCFKCEREIKKLGCHSICPEFIQYEKVHKEELEKIRKAKEKYKSPRYMMTDREFDNAGRSHNKNKVFKQHKG